MTFDQLARILEAKKQKEREKAELEAVKLPAPSRLNEVEAATFYDIEHTYHRPLDYRPPQRGKIRGSRSVNRRSLVEIANRITRRKHD